MRQIRERYDGESGGLSPFGFVVTPVRRYTGSPLHRDLLHRDLLHRDFRIRSAQFRYRMRDVLQHAVDGALGWVIGQVQHTGSLADGLAELESIGDLFAGSVNE